MTRLNRQEWARMAFGVALFAVTVLLISALVVSAITVAKVRDTQLTGTPTGRKLLESAEQILDCTRVGGVCYERGQQQTADAVSNINRVVILAAACSAGLDPQMSVARRQTAIQSCVISRLAAHPVH